MAGIVHISHDSQALAASAAGVVVQALRQAVNQFGRASIALSGGSTPRALYALLARPEYVAQVDWGKVTVFWGDERCVPPDHADSDYLLAKTALLDHLPAAKAPTIQRMRGEIDPTQAAQQYETHLRAYFGSQPAATFDVLLLGMGEDGHTASIFPNSSPVNERQRWSVAHYVPKLKAWRLTLTPPVLNLSQTTIFLVSGKTKAAVLKKVLQGPSVPDQLPAQSIQPANGKLLWFVDRESASSL